MNVNTSPPPPNIDLSMPLLDNNIRKSAYKQPALIVNVSYQLIPITNIYCLTQPLVFFYQFAYKLFYFTNCFISQAVFPDKKAFKMCNKAWLWNLENHLLCCIGKIQQLCVQMMYSAQQLDGCVESILVFIGHRHKHKHQDKRSNKRLQ